MKTSGTDLRYICPPGLLGTALLFWGWQAHWLWLSLLLAALVEAARWSPWRLPLSDLHFIRIADATSVSMVIAGVTFFAVKLSDGLFYLVQWLPVIIVFLLGAQLYSERQRTPLKAIVATLRRRPADNALPLSIDLRLPYFFLTLVAASIAPSTPAFYLLSGILIAWALWGARSRRYSAVLWFGFIGVALTLGFVFHMGLFQLQGVVQEVTTQWFESDWSDRDLNSNSTAIGKIGRLKLSEEIVMRIHASEPITRDGDLLLQQAEYNRYVGNTWFADNREEVPVLKNPANDTWFLSKRQPQHTHLITVATYLARGEGVLALPRGSYALHSNTPARFSRSAFGAVSVEDAPKLLNYVAYYDHDLPQSTPPAAHDLEVPVAYTRLISAIVNELGLATMPPEQAVLALKRFFADNFTYSLIQNEAQLQQNPLRFFLRQGRSGHCEYFATASVLLLRAAGIPARYATGFAMTEYDAANNVFVVRKRHAHAWTLAYLNGHWTELDYTPSTWAALEAEAAPWWQSGYDVISNVVFALNQWWLAKPRSLWDYLLVFLAIVLGFYLLSKVKPEKLRLKLIRHARAKTTDRVYPGGDSPFYKIIHYLEKTAAPRQTGEPITQWLQRLEKTSTLDLSALKPLLKQHYRYRFNTSAQEKIDKTAFNQQVDQWLAVNRKSPSHP